MVSRTVTATRSIRFRLPRLQGAGRRGPRLEILACAVLLLLATPPAVEAQVSRADSAAVLLQAADGFAAEGRWEIAEALYEHIAERFGGTPAAGEARARLAAPESERPQRPSRVELQVFGTTYGAWLGIAVPLALGADDPEAYGAGLLIGGPVGLLASRAYMNRNPVSEGQARAISWGGSWGTWQGYGWGEVFDLGENRVCYEFGCFETNEDEEELVASMVAGGIAGIVGGALLARSPIRSGVSSGAQGGSIWGTIYGTMITGIVDDDSGGDGLLTVALLSGNVGLIAGAALAAKHDLSRSDVRMINLGALVGGLGGLGLDLLIQPDSEEVALLIPLTASVIGLGIAASNTGGGGNGQEQVPDLDTPLLDYRDGRLSLAAPLPQPTLLPVERAGARTRWTPALSVGLFRARFF